MEVEVAVYVGTETAADPVTLTDSLKGKLSDKMVEHMQQYLKLDATSTAISADTIAQEQTSRLLPESEIKKITSGFQSGDRLKGEAQDFYRFLLTWTIPIRPETPAQ